MASELRESAAEITKLVTRFQSEQSDEARQAVLLQTQKLLMSFLRQLHLNQLIMTEKKLPLADAPGDYFLIRNWVDAARNLLSFDVYSKLCQWLDTYGRFLQGTGSVLSQPALGLSNLYIKEIRDLPAGEYFAYFCLV